MSVDFKVVRDTCDLTSFFEGVMGGKPKVVSGSLRYAVCPHCGPSSNASVKCSIRGQKWHCFACEQKGDIIDAAAHYFGIPHAQAAMELVNEAPRYKPPTNKPIIPVVERDQAAIDEVIDRLLKAQRQPDPTCLAYLEGRGIPRGIVVSAVFRKMLVTLPGDPNEALDYLRKVVGEELLRKSGIWKKDSKAPAIVYRPLAFVSSDKHGIEFRLIGESSVAMAKTIRYGEPSPWVWRGTNDHAMVVEGGIDMLSAIVLGTERTVYGLPGAKNWEDADAWILGLKGKNVLIALDADEAGERGAKDLTNVLTTLGATPRRHLPPEGCKDLNDELKLVRSQSN